MPRLDIAIVGGGIGGPCAAIGLAQNGHSVTLYERATTTGGVGFAFRIMPNADRCLKSLGIDTNQGGAVIANSSKLMSTKGEIIAKIRENADIEKAKKGASVFAYRVCFHLSNPESNPKLTIPNSRLYTTNCLIGSGKLVSF